MKKLIRMAIALCMATMTAIYPIQTVSFSVPVFAGTWDANASEWAKTDMEEAGALGIIPSELMGKAQEPITRKEFCLLAVQFYRVFTGKSGVTMGVNLFHDDSSNEVMLVTELGIMSGITPELFSPDGYVTREQLAQMVVNAAAACGIEIYDVGKNPVPFSDEVQINEEYMPSIQILEREKIINGYDGAYYPQTRVTVEQAISVFLKAYKAFKVYDINIDGNAIRFGQDAQELISVFGEPNEKLYNEFGFERYIYNSNLDNFFIVGVQDGVVREIFSNAKNMTYGEVTHSTPIADIGDYGIISSQERGRVVLKSYSANTTVYFDAGDSFKMDSVYIKDRRLVSDQKNYTVELSSITEKLLLQIINVGRSRRNMGSLEWSDLAASTAKKHSQDMRVAGEASYTGSEGLSPFERMQNAGIGFSTAAENVSWVMGDAIAIYGNWLGSVGTRTNIFNSDFTFAGIGSTISGNAICTTIDMFTP